MPQENEKPQEDMTPFERIVENLWNNPSVRLKGQEFFVQYMMGLASMHGLIDSLTPGCVVHRHNDPDCPGELRIKLATEGIVLVHYFFREAPGAKLVVEVPIADYKEGMEKAVNPEQAILGLVRMLLGKGAERQVGAEPKGPKLVLPKGES